MINHFFQKMLLAFLATRALSLPERSSHLLERASHVNGVRPVGLIDRKQPRTGTGEDHHIVLTHRNPGMEPRHCTTDSTGLECNHSHQREALQHAFHHRTKHP